VWKAVWEDANEGLKSYPGNWDMLDAFEAWGTGVGAADRRRRRSWARSVVTDWVETEPVSPARGR
jgi:hypothetical protein